MTMTDRKRIAQDGEAVAHEVPITDKGADASQSFTMAIDAAPLVGVERHQDGYLSGRVKAARTGVQDYLGKEVGWPEKDIVRVYRPLDEVMRLDSLGSYKGKPLTDGHPTERVTSQNWDKYAKGTIMGVQRDGDAVALDTVVYSASLVDKLEKGIARELSAGYRARISRESGTTPDGQPYDAVQRDIYIDHLAVVPRGRAGSEFRVGDDAGEWGVRPLDNRTSTEQPEKEDRQMADAHNTTVTVGDGTVRTDEAGSIRIKGLQDSLTAAEKQVVDLKAKITDLEKDIETKDGELTATKKSLADATAPKALADAAKKRSKNLEAGKKAGLKEEDMEDMEDADIQRAVVAKSIGDDAAKAMSDAAIEGAFSVAAASLKDKQPNTQRQNDSALAGGIQMQDSGEGSWDFLLNDKKG